MPNERLGRLIDRLQPMDTPVHLKRVRKRGLGVNTDHEGKPLTLQGQLNRMLAKNNVRVMDLFRAWDEDESGLVDVAEFRKGMQLLMGKGWASKDDIDALFKTYDKDGSGTIDYHELNNALRREAQLNDRLKAGALGEIQTKADVAHKIRQVPDKNNLHKNKLSQGAAMEGGTEKEVRSPYIV